MKNFKRILLLVVLSIFVLVGCGKDKDNKDKDPLVGEWAYGSFVYKFNDDKTGTYDALGTIMKFTYKTDGNKITIDYEDGGPFNTEYKIEDNTLIILDSFGNEVRYDKK